MAKNKPKLGEVALAGLLAGVTSSLINLGLANIARPTLKVPKEFAPYTLAPLLSGSVVGSAGTIPVFLLISRLSKNPARLFTIVALFLLVLSFQLPLRLLKTKSPRFKGANVKVVVSLMVMHTVVAVSNIIFHSRNAKK